MKDISSILKRVKKHQEKAVSDLQKANEVIAQLEQKLEELEHTPTITCKFCGTNLTKNARRHQRGYVCDSCWDERLRITE